MSINKAKNMTKGIIRLFILISVTILPAYPSRASQYEIGWEECVKIAKANNPDLVSAEAKVKQAVAAKEITRSAVMPQISGEGSELTSSPAGGLGSGASTPAQNRYTSYQYGITGQQLLFDAFKTSFDLSTAERSIIAARYFYDVTSSNVRLRLRTAFVNLLLAQELLTVTNEIETRRKQSLELVRSLYESGREHKGSLMNSDADLAQAQYQVSQAMRSIYLSQRQLYKELALKEFLPVNAKGDFDVMGTIHERPDFEKTARLSPLLQQLIALKEAAKYGLKSAGAQFFPSVYANASLGNSNTRWPPDGNAWSIGTSVSVPIFDGGNKFAVLSKSKAALGQAEADERSGRDGVIFTLAQTWTQLQNAVENVAVQKKFLDATQERARIARAEYAIGLMTYDNWIIIENNYISAKTTFLNAELQALIAEATWIQAKGGTLEHD